MHRAEIAAYVPAGLTAVIYFAMGFYAGQWENYSDFLAGTEVLGALGHALGQRHHAWAGMALIGYLLLVSVMRVVSEGRPPALLMIGVLGWLYFDGFQAAREFAALKDVQLEPRAPTA
jgi:hypothetical protein